MCPQRLATGKQRGAVAERRALAASNKDARPRTRARGRWVAAAERARRSRGCGACPEHAALHLPPAHCGPLATHMFGTMCIFSQARGLFGNRTR
jgi:hypothetical protein